MSVTSMPFAAAASAAVLPMTSMTMTVSHDLDIQSFHQLFKCMTCETPALSDTI